MTEIGLLQEIFRSIKDVYKTIQVDNEYITLEENGKDERIYILKLQNTRLGKTLLRQAGRLTLDIKKNEKVKLQVHRNLLMDLIDKGIGMTTLIHMKTEAREEYFKEIDEVMGQRPVEEKPGIVLSRGGDA